MDRADLAGFYVMIEKNQSASMSTLARIAILATLYIGAGALGLQLAVPPGYATVIWPASGIALAALLLYGVRLWPGILVGSFLLNCYVGSVFASGPINYPAILIAMSIAAGSTLQAVVAWSLIRKTYGIPIRLRSGYDLLKIAVVAGPVGCIVAATIGVTTLYAFGAVQGDAYIKNWASWWGGDTLGIILFLPIGVLNPLRPWTVQWDGKPVTAFSFGTLLLLAVPLFGTFVAWQAVSQLTYAHNIQSFRSLTDDSLHALDAKLLSYRQALDGGAGLFHASGRVTAQQWRDYVDTLKIEENLPGISGIGFIEPVDPADYDIYQRKVQTDGVIGLEVHPLVEAFDSFIIKYIEPLKPNLRARGLNIGFEKNRHDAAVHARDTGRPTITKRILLVQDTTESAGFLLLRPIYMGNPDFLRNVEALRTAFRGWVYAPFIAPRFLDALTATQGRDFNLRIYDGGEQDEGKLIFSTAPATSQAIYRVETKLPVMEQVWTVVWESTVAYEKGVASQTPLMVLAAGLALSFMFGALLLIFRHREETVQALVTSKTRELTVSEQQTRSIVDTAMVGILLLDENRLILSANNAAEQIFGRREGAMIGSRISELIGANRPCRTIGNKAEPRKARTADGREFYLEIQVNPWTALEGETRYTALVRDVTAEEEAKAALTENERRWNAALQGSEIGVYDLDLTTGIPIVSPTWKMMLGFHPDEKIDPNKEWESRIHPDDKAMVRQADQDCLSGATPRSITEYRIQRKDGEWIWIRSDTEVIERDNHGKPQRTIGTQVNITELRRTMDALQRSEERFRTAIQDAPVGMAMAAINREWIEVNEALCKLLGYSREELVGKQAYDFVYAGDVDPTDERPQKLINGEIGTYQREIRMLHKNGSLVWVLISISVASKLDDNTKYFITQFQDLTEIKEAEKLKTEFVATVSHELRTPLTSIRGSLGLVLGSMKADLPANASRLLTIAHNNCERLVLLINDILDLEKISNGSMRFDLRKENIADVIRQAFDANQGYADEHGIRQELVEPLPKSAVKVDLTRLHQVFANLLSNAAKFSREGATIRLSAEETSEGVKVMVTDQGPGISPEFQGKIFGRFSQADSSATRAKGGTGLGLHISKQIIEHMGGEIGFDSTPGEGSTFWITLPTDQEQESGFAAAAPNANLPSILHVEDDRDFSEVVSAYLRDEASVTCAATIPEARSLLQTDHFDMVIIDIGLYNGSGLELLDQVSGLDLPVIVLTAQEDYDPDTRVGAYLPKSRVTEARVVETVVGMLKAHKDGMRSNQKTVGGKR